MVGLTRAHGRMIPLQHVNADRRVRFPYIYSVVNNKPENVKHRIQLDFDSVLWLSTTQRRFEAKASRRAAENELYVKWCFRKIRAGEEGPRWDCVYGEATSRGLLLDPFLGIGDGCGGPR